MAFEVNISFMCPNTATHARVHVSDFTKPRRCTCSSISTRTNRIEQIQNERSKRQQQQRTRVHGVRQEGKQASECIAQALTSQRAAVWSSTPFRQVPLLPRPRSSRTDVAGVDVVPAAGLRSRLARAAAPIRRPWLSARFQLWSTSLHSGPSSEGSSTLHTSNAYPAFA